MHYLISHIYVIKRACENYETHTQSLEKKKILKGFLNYKQVQKKITLKD